MTRSLITLIALISSLAACATPGAAPLESSTSDGSDDYDCEEDAPTGSHMNAKNCRTVSRKKEDKRQAEELIHKPVQSPVKSQ